MRAQQGFGSIKTFRSTLPRHYAPYAGIALPATDLNLSIGISERGQENYTASGTLRAFGDFAFMNGKLFISADKNDITNAYMSLGRSDPDGTLLGPLGATAWEIGDVTATSVPLVSSRQSGRGIHLTSRTASYVAEFDRITLEDVLPNGYEVELYRNDILMMAQRTSRPDGKYRFDNIILLRGQNTIRLEFYGPQGQRYTETKSYFVGHNRLPKGAVHYDISFFQASRPLFITNNYNSSNKYNRNDIGASISLDFGLSRSWSMTSSFVRVPVIMDQNTEDERFDTRLYSGLGLRTQLMGIGIALNSAFDDLGGQAFGINAQTRFNKWDLSLNHQTYHSGFSNQVITTTDPDNVNTNNLQTSSSSSRLHRNFSLARLNITFGIQGNYTTYKNQNDSWDFGNELGINYRGVSLNNNIRYNVGSTDEYTQGSINLNINPGKGFSLRGSGNYNSKNPTTFDS